MRIHAADPLFAWGQLEDHATLATIRDFLRAVPDRELLDGLRAARGKGRDDYPVALLWRIVLLTILLRHVSFNACLAELHRNPALCRLLDLADEAAIPNGWNGSRFLDVLGQEAQLTALRRVFDHLARRLGVAVPGPPPAAPPPGRGPRGGGGGGGGPRGGPPHRRRRHRPGGPRQGRPQGGEGGGPAGAAPAVGRQEGVH